MSYIYSYSIAISKFQWSQHNLQSNYAGSAEETNSPIYYTEQFAENTKKSSPERKISKVEKIKCASLEFYFDLASSSTNSTSGACLLAWAPSWKLTFFITPAFGAFIVCCTETDQEWASRVLFSLPLPQMLILLVGAVRTEHNYFFRHMYIYFKPSFRMLF